MFHLLSHPSNIWKFDLQKLVHPNLSNLNKISVEFVMTKSIFLFLNCDSEFVIKMLFKKNNVIYIAQSSHKQAIGQSLKTKLCLCSCVNCILKKKKIIIKNIIRNYNAETCCIILQKKNKTSLKVGCSAVLREC